MSEELIASLKQHEGLRLCAYRDSKGVWTVGYGRNLQCLKITPELAEQWLREDAETALAEAQRFAEFAYLDTPARRDVFIEMVFNMGPERLSGFTNTLAAIRAQHWAAVARHMLDSLWADQVKSRAYTLARRMESGEY